MKKEKLNKYPTHPFVVAMENKVFASSFFLMIGGLGTAVYGIATNNEDLAKFALSTVAMPGIAGISLTNLGADTIYEYRRYIDRYKEGDNYLLKIDHKKNLKHYAYCNRVGARRAIRDIEEGKVTQSVDTIV